LVAGRQVMVQRYGASRPMTGWNFVAVGAVLCVLAVILINVFGGTPPDHGRLETVIILGFPLGVVFIVIGLVKLIIERVRRSR
jgi:hypothetical protein